MARLTISEQGEVTLRKEDLDHLGVRPGGSIDLDLLPERQLKLRATPSGTIEDFIGILAGKTTKIATLEEIEEATQMGWAGLVKF